MNIEIHASKRIKSSSASVFCSNIRAFSITLLPLTCYFLSTLHVTLQDQSGLQIVLARVAVGDAETVHHLVGWVRPCWEE